MNEKDFDQFDELDRQMWALEHPGEELPVGRKQQEPTAPASVRTESVTTDVYRQQFNDVSVPIEAAAPAPVTTNIYEQRFEDAGVPIEAAAPAPVTTNVYEQRFDDAGVPIEAAAPAPVTTDIYPQTAPQGMPAERAPQPQGQTANTEAAPYGNVYPQAVPGQPQDNSGNIQGAQVPTQIPGEADDGMKKGNNPILLAVMGVLFVLMVGLSIYVAIYLSKSFKIGRQADKKYQSDSENPWDDFFGKDEKKDREIKPDDADDFFADREEEKKERENDSTDEDNAPERDFSQYEDLNWMDYDNHDASEYEGAEFYENFEDCIDESLSYSIVRNYDTIENRSGGVLARCSYVELSGARIPNLDAINEKLKEYGEYYLNYYRDNQKAIDEILAGSSDAIFYSNTKCYVTYTDEDMASIIFEDRVHLAGGGEYHLTSVNINLMTGTILDNATMLSLPDDFGAYFRERNLKQNGADNGTKDFTDEQILEHLNDPADQIIFYTPVGLEVGYEYSFGRYSGWVTISLKDYQKYLKGV